MTPLRVEAVPPDLLHLLVHLMQDPALETFDLVGGTSLALRYGHRTSVDLDLFTQAPFDAVELSRHLQQAHALHDARTSTNSVNGVIGSIKVDFMAHQYPQLKPTEAVDGIRLTSIEDVAAMKLNAIANRGSKKDFWDCARLLQDFSVEQLLQFCGRKYQGDSIWNVERSLCYFDDAESDPDPRDHMGWNWEEVKTILREATRSAG